MNVIILYDSVTGNTEYLAKELEKAMPGVPCCRVGTLSVAENEILETADLVYLGFWTDKGTCSEPLRAILPSLAGKKIFLFGTAGFAASENYYARIIAQIQSELPPDCAVIGWYMCAGRMSEAIRLRYEVMLENPDTKAKAEQLLANFEAAMPHPNSDDALALLKKAGV